MYVELGVVSRQHLCGVGMCSYRGKGVPRATARVWADTTGFSGDGKAEGARRRKDDCEFGWDPLSPRCFSNLLVEMLNLWNRDRSSFHC